MRAPLSGDMGAGAEIVTPGIGPLTVGLSGFELLLAPTHAPAPSRAQTDAAKKRYLITSPVQRYALASTDIPSYRCMRMRALASTAVRPGWGADRGRNCGSTNQDRVTSKGCQGALCRPRA